MAYTSCECKFENISTFAPYARTWQPLTDGTVSAPSSVLTATPSCPSCFFGATAATLYSFPYDIVETITISTVPYTSTCEDGEITTSTAIITPTPTVDLPADAPTFTVGHYTWNVSGVSMAYPSTYIHYLGFEKDSFLQTAVADVNDTCAGTTFATLAELPTPTNPTAFIYPVTDSIWTTTFLSTLFFSVPLPTSMVSYLDNIATQDPCASALIDVTACKPIQTSWTNSPPPLCDTTYSTTYSTVTVPIAALHTPAVPIRPPPLYNATTAAVATASASVGSSITTIVNCTPTLHMWKGQSADTVLIPGTDTPPSARGYTTTSFHPQPFPSDDGLLGSQTSATSKHKASATTILTTVTAKPSALGNQTKNGL